MKKSVLAVLALLCIIPSHTASAQAYSGKLAHTYSIVARDPGTGEMGVAVQSNWFSVGSLVSWAEAGVGAIATQSFVNVSLGPRGLELLKQGKSAQEVLDELIEADEGRDVRQLAIVDTHGNAAAWTGSKCIPDAGHYTGDNFSVQANLMLNDRVWPAMQRAFRNERGPLAERMVAALEAAQEAGGDIRGKQSAAILVVRGESTGNIWEDRLIDLRIEDHATPISEIRRLLNMYRAYEHMNAGDLAIEHNDVEGALREYGAAEVMFPDNLEMKYWHAVSLANAGRIGESLPIFRDIFSKDPNWHMLTGRLPEVDLLTVSDADLRRILSQR
ncbi:DUF1028 domain-containing protein [candidate division KSB1 bacterium]